MLAACARLPQANGDVYTVRPGDTLFSLGRAFNQDYRDIAAWNNIVAKDAIRVGQVLRIRPPRTVVKSSAATPKRVAPARQDAPVKNDVGVAARMNWRWPAQGRVRMATDRKQKGIDISGTVGQPVWAAASGKVIYAGQGIRGYGNMIIVKHSPSLLSVYAHNKVIQIKEGQIVDRGQQIAEMGDTDSSTVKLHFEIRDNGKPLNPLSLLPKQ